MILTSDFDYYLPEELIAQVPSSKRDESRLLVLNRTRQTIEHRHFRNITDYLTPQDLLVLNNTKVIPARLIGRKETGGRVKVMLLNEEGNDRWKVLVDVGRGLACGKVLTFGKGLTAKVVEPPKEGGITILKFSYKGNFGRLLEKLGEIPLPPYIKKAEPETKCLGSLNPEKREPVSLPSEVWETKEGLFSGSRLQERYQTVYAKITGATAAPTAGLHFTKELLKKIKNKVFITLHTGYGTFKPVSVKNIEDHHIDKEYFEITPAAARKINSATGKIVAVGTTSVRALETMASSSGKIKSGKGSTDLFIYPGYKFKIVEAMITNFHLPRSTLLMLVSAFAGKDFIMRAYQEAIAKKYRFYSFGDAMLIL